MSTLPSIAFFDIPYHSRLVTTLPLVKALVARGHRIDGFTLEPFASLLASSGAQVICQPPFGIMPKDCTVNLRTIEYSMEAVPFLVAKLQELRPALVLLTAKCLWAAIAAERCGIKTAVIHTNALMPRGAKVSNAVYAARWPGKSESELAVIEQRDQSAWEICRAQYDIERIDSRDVLPGLPNCMNLRGELNVVYTSDALQPHRQEFDDSYHFVGPCYDQRPADADSAVEAALDRLPRPLVYCALGSMRHYNDRQNFFQSVLTACGDGRFGVVMSVGSQEAAASFDEIPPHVLVKPYVPQLAVLDRASVFVTHAGTNSVFESLLAGVPMLMCPQGGDQPIFAEQIESLGAGRWLHEASLDAPMLRSQIESVLTHPQMARQARTIGDGLRAAGGTVRAAEIISDFAQQSLQTQIPPASSRGLAV